MGKVQRHQGANQADRWRKHLGKRRRSSWRLPYIFPLVMVPLDAFFTFSPSSLESVTSVVPNGWLGSAGGCEIKGNISINTGERIYHVPGQEHYWETKISPQYGERWFCSEAEARAAGWRKARR
ncbi:sunset domain-containing protein [Mesorhizobium sp. LjNodule214]|uniref:sunset domain-containing protein n=1 Tax=Mesorhizobium sp. LjNodule214 TaxID=3342252 RepID=UPI003ED03B4D